MLSLATPKLDCSSLLYSLYLLQSKRKCLHTVSGALQSGHFPSLCLPNLKRVSFSKQLPTRSL